MAGNGSQNMSWTEATSDDYGAIAAAFKEVLGSITLVIQDASPAILGMVRTVSHLVEVRPYKGKEKK